jgi:EF-hand domain pair
MLFRLAFLLFIFSGAILPNGEYAYGHDCPLQQAGRLETFRALDRDKDGRLTLAEFMTQGWCQAVPSCQCQDAARQLFSRMDKNGDGFVTLEEFQAFAREKPRPGGSAVTR